MARVFYYLRNDKRAALLLTFNKMRKSWIYMYSKLIMTIEMKLIGVSYAKNVKWGGLSQIERFPMSNIIIGAQCAFNSVSLFNQRGIRKCIIQTGASGAVIKIGDNCGFSGVSIVADKKVEIGNHVLVGANTIIGDRDDHPERLHTIPATVKICDNVFVGMHCIIMKGVTIGENSIIAAGSIVTNDIPANCVAGGVPCKVIKYIQ